MKIALSAFSYKLITLALGVYTVVLMNVKLRPVGVAQTVETVYRGNLQRFTDNQGSSGTLFQIATLTQVWFFLPMKLFGSGKKKKK